MTETRTKPQAGLILKAGQWPQGGSEHTAQVNVLVFAPEVKPLSGALCWRKRAFLALYRKVSGGESHSGEVGPWAFFLQSASNSFK